MQVRKITLYDFIADKPAIVRAFEQAKMRENQSFKLADRGFSAISFPRQAVCIGGFYEQFSKSDIILRIIPVSSFLISASITMFATTGYALPLLLAFPAIYLYKNWEESRATKLLNDLAIKEFATAFPMKGVTEYIVSSPLLLQKLLSESQDAAFKLDGNGMTFWDLVCKKAKKHTNSNIDLDNTEFSLFKAVADVIFSSISLLSLQEKKANFLQAINSNNPAFIKYLLEESKVRSTDFNELEQFNLWNNLYGIYSESKDRDISSLLIKHGFNIDAKNNSNRTILTQILFLGSRLKRNDLSVLKELLDLGAHSNSKICFGDNDNDVFKFVMNDSNLRDLLQNHIDKPIDYDHEDVI